jgi:hypothetical protein
MTEIAGAIEGATDMWINTLSGSEIAKVRAAATSQKPRLCLGEERIKAA